MHQRQCDTHGIARHFPWMLKHRQLALALVVSLLLASSVGVLALTSQPTARAEGEGGIIATQLDGSDLDTTQLGDPTGARIGSEQAHSTEVHTDDIRADTDLHAAGPNPVVADKPLYPGAATQQHALAGAEVQNGGNPRSEAPPSELPSLEVVAQLTADAAAAQTGDQRETATGEVTPSVASGQGNPSDQQDVSTVEAEAAAKAAEAREAAITTFRRDATVQVRGRLPWLKSDATVSNEQAAAAVDAMTDAKNALQGLGDQANSDKDRAMGVVPNRVSIGYAQSAAFSGSKAVSQLQNSAGFLAAAHALGFETLQAASLTPEAAELAASATTLASLSALKLSSDPRRASDLAYQASIAFSKAAKLAVQSTKNGYSFDTGESDQRPGYKATVGSAAGASLAATNSLITAAAKSAYAIETSGRSTDPLQASFQEAKKEAEDAIAAASGLGPKPPSQLSIRCQGISCYK